MKSFLFYSSSRWMIGLDWDSFLGLPGWVYFVMAIYPSDLAI